MKTRINRLWNKPLLFITYILLSCILLGFLTNIPSYVYKNASILEQGITSIRGTSMVPTFNDSEVLYTKPAEYTRGAIVVSQFPSGSKYSSDNDMALLKRIVGLPGEIVEITEEGIKINDVLLDEPYTDTAQYTLAKENEVNEIILSDNEYFLVGDNRQNSFDSRHIGAVNGALFMYSVTTEPNEWTEQVRTKFISLAVTMWIVAIGLIVTLLFVFSSEKFISLFEKKKKEIHVPTKVVRHSKSNSSKKKHKKKK